MPDVGVMLPVRLETRFKGGDLWVRVVPDEPWFLRDDSRLGPGELDALRRYAAAPHETGPDGVPPAWRDLAAAVGAPRAAALHRRFVSTAPDGSIVVREPGIDEVRAEPAVSRIANFPAELVVWASVGRDHREVLRLTVDRARLLADFADPDIPDDRRWWESWQEAVEIGMAGIVPASEVAAGIDALFVTGLGDADPGAHFADLVAEGRVGLVEPGTPTNSIDGAPAAPLALDADTWWRLLSTPASEADTDVSEALTGDATQLGNMPGGDRAHRAPSSALVSVLWPALWGFAAAHVFDVARGPAVARWAAAAMFPVGGYSTVRIGPQPYGLLPASCWSEWQPADGDPEFEAALLRALVRIRDGHARGARARGTAAGKTTEELLGLIADTPTSSCFRYRPAWPLELWWVGMVGSGFAQPWRALAERWSTRHPLADEIGVRPVRQYATTGRSRRVGVPLVLPSGVAAAALPELLTKIADTASTNPAGFANTARLESDMLGLRSGSLLIRLAIRSLQLLIAELPRERDSIVGVDPEPFARNDRARGRLEALLLSATPAEAPATSGARQHLEDVTIALRALGSVPVRELEWMVAAAIDCSNHRIDPWLLAPAQRRLDSLLANGTARHRLGAYGWVDAPSPGNPGPTAGGLLHGPSPSAALAAAVLRSRALTDDSDRWQLDITSRTARVADRLAENVRLGAHLAEALGREVERIIGDTVAIETLRRQFPVRTEHAGKRVCDGIQVLAARQLPMTLTPDQEATLQELRDALDTYADLLVADAVHHLAEGRSEVAGAVMDGAAGLSRTPELSLLRTPRSGRAVSTSAVMVLPAVADTPLPVRDADRAVISPAVVIDPSVAAFIASEVGPASTWDFDVRFAGAAVAVPVVRTVRLADLGLGPVDAMAVTRTRLEELAVDLAAEMEGLDVRADGVTGAVVGGTGAARYARASDVTGLIGRNPATLRALSPSPTTEPAEEAVDAALLARYEATREVCAALVRELRAQVAQFGPSGEVAGADPAVVRRLVLACARWGIAPAPPDLSDDPAAPVTNAERQLQRLPDTATRALAALEERLAAAPEAPAAGQLGRDEMLAAATALVSPTGQVALTARLEAAAIPAVDRVDGEAGFDASWLTVVAAVRPALARLESHQLGAQRPLVPWINRVADPWQTTSSDPRLVAVYAPADLDLSRTSGPVAVATLDGFTEVIPAAEQDTGGAFGFESPASRAPQAILLAIPPVIDEPLDQETLARIVADTRTSAHARMARPVDLEEQFWGLAPTCLLPASGTVATILEPRL